MTCVVGMCVDSPPYLIPHPHLTLYTPNAHSLEPATTYMPSKPLLGILIHLQMSLFLLLVYLTDDYWAALGCKALKEIQH